MPERPLEELQAQIGDSYTSVENFEVEKGKVIEFARAIHEDNPAFFSESAANDQGFERIPAPLTFVRTQMFPRFRTGDEDLGFAGEKPFDLTFDPAYRVHGEQEYEYERPLFVGDVLSGTTTLADVYQREGRRGGTMTFAALETVFSDQNDEKVLSERTVLIEPAAGITESDGEDDGTDSIEDTAASGGE